MKIRFDYSWLPEKVRDIIAKEDPTKDDLAISEEDFLTIGWNRYQQIVRIAREHSKSTDPRTPYVINMPTGETLLMTDAEYGNKSYPLRHHIYSKGGASAGFIPLDPRTRRVVDFENVGGGSGSYDIVDLLCSGHNRETGKCDWRKVARPLMYGRAYGHIFPNRFSYRIIDRTPPQFQLNILEAMSKGAGQLEIVTGERQGEQLMFSLGLLSVGLA